MERTPQTDVQVAMYWVGVELCIAYVLVDVHDVDVNGDKGGNGLLTLWADGSDAIGIGSKIHILDEVVPVLIGNDFAITTDDVVVIGIQRLPVQVDLIHVGIALQLQGGHQGDGVRRRELYVIDPTAIVAIATATVL